MKARPLNAIPELTAIGVDIGKDIFHIVGFGADGKIALHRKNCATAVLVPER
jgi:hypothetical protein